MLRTKTRICVGRTLTVAIRKPFLLMMASSAASTGNRVHDIADFQWRWPLGIVGIANVSVAVSVVRRTQTIYKEDIERRTYKKDDDLK